MKLLVTGGAGYVGSVCAAVLLEQGHDVTIVDNFSTGNREAVPTGATLVEGDIRDKAGEILASDSYDAVLHFAARSLVGESVEKPSEYWQHNFVTTLALLDAMRANNVTNLVFLLLRQPTANLLLCPSQRTSPLSRPILTVLLSLQSTTP